MAKISISKINFDDVIPYKKALDTLSPAAQIGNLNSALVYTKATNELVLYVSDSTATAKLMIQADIEATGINEDFGFYMDFRKFFDIVVSYNTEVRSTIRIDLDLGPSSFRLFTEIDKLSLPHLEMTPEQVYEVVNNPLLVLPNDVSFSLSNFSNRKDFLTGVQNCFKFIGTADKKNNALAVYNDKIVVNDRRHIFIYNFEEANTSIEVEPVSIHKISAKVLGNMPTDQFEFTITKDGRRSILTDKTIMFVMNNAMSNIMPPSEEDLNNIRSNQKSFSMKSNHMYEISTFFKQFYSAAMEQEPLTIEVADGLTFILKDSGLVGYNSCNVERKVDTEIIATESSTSTIINGSLLTFLNLLAEDISVDVYVDAQHPAVYCDTVKRKLYLAKLGGA